MDTLWGGEREGRGDDYKGSTRDLCRAGIVLYLDCGGGSPDMYM